MANFVYTHAKKLLLDGALDFGSDDIRVMLLMDNTTADTEEDVDTIGDFTTDDEFDGAGYSTPGLPLAGEATSEDEANDRGEFDANDLTFPSISAGSRPIQAALIYKFVTNKAASIPLAFIDDDFPITPGGGDITFTWNAEGIIQAT